jgi:hypothetical protein
MGQRTLAFTKQMLRIFNLVELEEPDHLVANSWCSIPRSAETNRDLIEAKTDRHKQANTYMHKNITPYKYKHNKTCKTKKSALLRSRDEKRRDSRGYGREANVFTLSK